MNCYSNRELSWLEFNLRVLLNAEDRNVPLCERLNFFSIFQSNLDEFFMVRIGSLHDQQILNDGVRENKTGMTPSGQIDAALKKIALICEKRDEVYLSLLEDLKDQNIHIVRFSEITAAAEKELKRMFTDDVLPYISFYTVQKKQDFPFLNNREIYAIACLDSRKGKPVIAIVPCKVSALPRLISVPGREGYYILLEEFILHYLPMLFPRQKLAGKTLARITRNADIDADAVYDEDLNYRDHMADIIKQRKRLCPVRLELSRQIDKEIVSLLCEALHLSESQVFEYDTPLDLSFLFQFSDILRHNPRLFYEPKNARKRPPAYEEDQIMETVQHHDVLLHYPYDSFSTFLGLLREASRNPQVKSIRMTLYRLARDSKVAELLAEAAENGKDVEVFVELKARFDEENNIEWSRRLESAGCKVIYGIEHIKVHCKLCLIRFTDDSGNDRFITQIGTGNYNEKTSRIYTDFCLITANQAIGNDGWDVFQALMQGETVKSADRLLVSPNYMESPLADMIAAEIKKKEQGRIRLKLNSLTDKALIDKLIEASQAGVKINLVVRGICCLLPGIPEQTENLRVVSIVGRYLEHSRMYLFGERDELKAYISSADWMTRNMTRRVEIACPVSDPAQKAMLARIFDTCMQDNAQSWELRPDGSYRRNIGTELNTINAQIAFYGEEFRTDLP